MFCNIKKVVFILNLSETMEIFKNITDQVYKEGIIIIINLFKVD